MKNEMKITNDYGKEIPVKLYMKNDHPMISFGNGCHYYLDTILFTGWDRNDPDRILESRGLCLVGSDNSYDLSHNHMTTVRAFAVKWLISMVENRHAY